MTEIKIKNELFYGANDKASLYDLETPKNWNGELIIFLHGYMGYKDWGCWNLVQSYFVENKYGFLKYNVSHNGGTVTNPIDFDDLDSFSNNSYSKEILDFEAIIKLIENKFDKVPEIHLIGHSRGGGIALLQSNNKSISKICSWAGIASTDRFPTGDLLQKWKEDGVRYGNNGRTKQRMPHNYSQYEDYLANIDRLDIEAHCKSSTVKTLIVHGDNDVSVNISEGETLSQWLNTDLKTIKNTQHTFDSAQPWKEELMPEALQEVCQITLNFLNQ